jgi:Galactocerebrosidase, C-terminal lectin domain
MALSLVLGLQPSSDATAQTTATRLDFENDAPGALPAGFRAGLTGKGGPVKWSVVEDASAPAGPKVLAEASGDRTDYRFPIALYESVSARDVDVTVRFKPVSGRVDQAAGVIVRARDDNNYYVARANALENNVRLYRVVRGNRQQFAGVDIPVASGRWQQLGLRVQGDRFTVSLDGKPVFEASDRTFTEAGAVGLWTKADSVTYFDELVVRPLP